MPCTAHTTGFQTFCHFGLSSSPGILVVPDVVGLAVGLLGVEAGAEGPVAGGPQHDGVHRRVVLHQAPRVADLLAHLAVEGVEHLGPVRA